MNIQINVTKKLVRIPNDIGMTSVYSESKIDLKKKPEYIEFYVYEYPNSWYEEDFIEEGFTV